MGITLTRRIAACRIWSHIKVYQEIVRLALADNYDALRSEEGLLTFAG